MVHAAHLDFETIESETHYEMNDQYSLTKLCNILFTHSLADRFGSETLTINSLHPGIINTKLLRTAWSGGQDPEIAAKNLEYLIDADISGMYSKFYFENGRPMQSTPISYDKQTQDKLWDISSKKIEKYL
jgi:NAD(P)-dependent dehydrogenase (short-subunit alcohol dehydrogenase family)